MSLMRESRYHIIFVRTIVEHNGSLRKGMTPIAQLIDFHTNNVSRYNRRQMPEIELTDSVSTEAKPIHTKRRGNSVLTQQAYVQFDWSSGSWEDSGTLWANDLRCEGQRYTLQW